MNDIQDSQREDSTSTKATRPKDFFYDNILKRSTQSFLLALVIVMSYVIFFAWMIGSAPKVSDTYNYDGLEKLTATFGLIVATVVGYYFGQRQVEEASERAKKVGMEAEKAKTEATEQKVEAEKAKTEAVQNKDKLKEELTQRMDSMDTGLKIYSDAKKVAEKLSTLPEDEKKIVQDKLPDVNIADLTKELDDRINELRAKKEVKKETLKNI